MHCKQTLRMCLVTLSWICICTYISSAQTISPDDLLSPTEIHHDLYGFNGEYMMDQCFESDDPYSSPQLPYSSIYLSHSCKELVEEVSPGVVRFPGGITANFYHFYGNGYGFELSETFGNSIGPVDPSLDRLMPVNFIVPFADLALQTNSKVIFTLNLYTHFKAGDAALNVLTSQAYLNRLEENMAALQYLTDRGVEIVGIELGNEMYSYSELTSIFIINPAIDKYLVIAENYTDTIRSRFPGIPIGVPIAINRGFGGTTWNQKMQQADFAEGRVIHEYERLVYNHCDSETNRESYFDCAKNRVENFFDQTFEDALLEYVELYPEKELWLTEWGMSQPHKLANTYFDAYFVFKYWNNLMDFQKKYPSVVAFALRHNLISSGYSYSAFSQKYIDESSELYYNGNKTIHASAYAHKLMAPLLNGDNEFIGRTTLGNFDAWVYRTASGDYKVAVINETNIAGSFNISQLENQLGISGLELQSSSALSATNYYDAAGISYWGEDLPYTNELDYVENIILSNVEIFNVDALSLSIININKTESNAVPSVSDLETVVDANCQFQASWMVTDDAPGLTMQVALLLNGLHTASTTIPSSGIGAYNHTFDLNENGSYELEIILLDPIDTLDTDLSLLSNVNCISIPDPEIVSFDIIARTDCSLDLIWSVENETFTGHYSIQVSFNGAAFAETMTIPAFENTPLATHQVNYIPGLNGDYIFRIERIVNSVIQSSSQEIEEVISCIIAADPYLISFRVLSSSDCGLQLSWAVGDESELGSYSIFMGNESASMSRIDEIPSSGADFVAHYTYDFTPEISSEYNFLIRRFQNGIPHLTTDLESAIITCIPEILPEFISFETTQNLNCSVSLEWEITNENDLGLYKVLTSFNGSLFTPTAYIPSSGAGTNVIYNYDFNPQENGNYAFKIERLENNLTTSETNINDVLVDCIPDVGPEAVIQTFTTDFNPVNCTIDLNWIVSDEKIGGVYYMMISHDGAPYSSAGFLYSAGNLPTATYNFTINSVENGNYSIQIIRYETGAFHSSSDIENTIVACDELPPPALVDFSQYVDPSCNIVLNWSAEHLTPGSQFILYVSRGNIQSLIIGTFSYDGNAEDNFTFNYTPQTNGPHTFELVLLENGQSIASYSTGNIVINCAMTAQLSLSISPPVTTGAFDVKVMTNVNMEAQLLIVNTSSGDVVIDQNINLVTGENIIPYNLDNIAGAVSGIHQVVIIYNGNTQSRTVLYLG